MMLSLGRIIPRLFTSLRSTMAQESNSIWLWQDDNLFGFRGLLESQAKNVIKNSMNSFNIFDHIPSTALNKGTSAAS